MVRRGAAAAPALRFVDVGGHQLEYAEEPAAAPGRPTLVFLHEGLGCVAMWRGFPGLVAARTSCRAVVYSRRGYGGSDPFDEPRTPRYLHDEALDVLPGLRAALGLDRVVLVGHSDGASIALIHAGPGGGPSTAWSSWRRTRSSRTRRWQASRRPFESGGR